MTTTENKVPDPELAAAVDTAGGATAPGIATGYEGTIGDQFRAYIARVRSGEMGMLPAIGGFIVLCILFEILTQGDFLGLLNVSNLITQTAFLAMLAVALVFVILLGEIDLSAGVTAGVGMAVFVQLNNSLHINWFLALIVSLVVGIVIGGFIGYFVAKVGIPSFVVTLGLFLGFQGLQLVLLGNGNSYRITDPSVLAIENSNMPVWAGWLMWAVIVLVSLGSAFYDRTRRQRAGVPVRPISMLAIRVGAVAVFTGIIVALLNQDRSVSVVPVQGVPIVVPIVLAILWIATQVLDRTRWGLHLYAVGGNPEAARRAGISVAAIRISAFVLCSTLAIVSGLFQASEVGVVGSSFGQTDVLNGVAAAVVGGVSLFGGRGRLVQGVVGALVITAITNGLGLMSLPGGVNLLITGGVLILAATVDALSRKRAGASLARV
ncbi:ABC transporter permease [Amnibacterium sp. CER49]|uniref:sugar ABC transporter permease n=1 Tax=Amnibacterium sp. CER49 TaxID=3039161 RepID=UPI00244845CA|nr:ABC transporter permease [Amnibacterium sp. CER49]MDH2443161.1 ABC transporter permease [Amnibacterium sp. CER49]